MESRARVITALSHQEPDRIPLDFEARDEVIQGLLKVLGFSEQEDILNYFGIDFRRAGLDPGEEFQRRGAFFHPRRKWVVEIGSNLYEDEFGIQYCVDGEGRYFGFVRHPLERDEDLASYRFPDFGEEGRYRSLKECITRYRDTFFIQGDATLTLFEQAWQMSGYEHFVYNLYQNPAWIEQLLDKILQLRMIQCQKYVEIGVDVVWLGDDFGMQDRMMINPDLWRKYFKPRMRELIRYCRSLRPTIFIQYHSDGYIEPIIEDLIEVGIDILNPVQPECMSLKAIKEKYGTRLTLHGTISVQSLLPFANREELQKELVEIVNVCAPGGGYIAAPTHAIQMDVPVENLIFLYDFLKSWKYEE